MVLELYSRNGKRTQRRPRVLGHDQPSRAWATTPAKRRRILDAALGCFDEKGMAATTIDDICAAAGLQRRQHLPPLRRQGRHLRAPRPRGACRLSRRRSSTPSTVPQAPNSRSGGSSRFHVALGRGPPCAYAADAPLGGSRTRPPQRTRALRPVQRGDRRLAAHARLEPGAFAGWSPTSTRPCSWAR